MNQMTTQTMQEFKHSVPHGEHVLIHLFCLGSQIELLD